MLDASAKVAPGFIVGNNHWLGYPNGCKLTNHPLGAALSDRYNRSMDPNVITSFSRKSSFRSWFQNGLHWTFFKVADTSRVVFWKCASYWFVSAHKLLQRRRILSHNGKFEQRIIGSSSTEWHKNFRSEGS